MAEDQPQKLDPKYLKGLNAGYALREQMPQVYTDLTKGMAQVEHSEFAKGFREGGQGFDRDQALNKMAPDPPEPPSGPGGYRYSDRSDKSTPDRNRDRGKDLDR